MKKVKIINKKLSYASRILSNQSYKIVHGSLASRGSMLSYGCLNLTITIEFNEKDLKQNNIVWENLKNYDSLSFIIVNKSLLTRMKLSSTNSTLQTLLHMNKILEKKIKIKHTLIPISFFKYLNLYKLLYI